MLRRIVFCIAMVLIFLGLQRLLVPKYAESPVEGSLIAAYYASTMSHDVIFIGDCDMYTGFSPAVLWEDFGITSHVRGSPRQLIWQSYYILRDTLRHETPQVVVVGLGPMQLAENLEPYNRLVLDGMRWSRDKVNAIRASMTDSESWLSYILPFFRFKDRWHSLQREDFTYFFRNPRVCFNGFLVRTDVVPAGFIPRPAAFVPDFGAQAVDYLERMANLANAAGIRLILIVSPTLYPHWHERWDAWARNFAETHGVTFANFRSKIYEIGIDFATDTFNAGLNLNFFGAQKLTRFFAENFLQDMAGIRRSASVIAHFDALAAAQRAAVAGASD